MMGAPSPASVTDSLRGVAERRGGDRATEPRRVQRLAFPPPPRTASPYRRNSSYATSPTILSEAADTLSMVSSGVWCQG